MSLSDVSKSLPDLSVSIGGLTLPSPLIIASGLWPHDASFWQEPYSEGVGAICSKGLTRRPRAGNSGIRIWETPSGVLNSIGLQNRGVEVFIKEELPLLSKADSRIVNLAVESLEETTESLVLLKSVEKDISAVELNVLCPNVDCGGMAWGMSADGVSSVLLAARKAWEGKLWVKLTPQAFDLPAVGRAAEVAVLMPWWYQILGLEWPSTWKPKARIRQDICGPVRPRRISSCIAMSLRGGRVGLHTCDRLWRRLQRRRCIGHAPCRGCRRRDRQHADA